MKQTKTQYATRACLVKAMVSPVVMYECKGWTLTFFSKEILERKIQLLAVSFSTSWETRLLQPSGEGKVIQAEELLGMSELAGSPLPGT